MKVSKKKKENKGRKCMHYCNIKQLRNITKLECPKDIKSWHNKIFLPVLGQA